MTTMAQELTGQVALVTGGSRGIGLAIARELAAAGACVAVVARDGARASEAAAGLPGTGHAGFACDVADPDSVGATIEAVVGASLARISALVREGRTAPSSTSPMRTSRARRNSSRAARGSASRRSTRRVTRRTTRAGR